ncbi:monooxygenase [Penicillium hispanicum]|uniref:monooxygenase n=1 Tax=Penicillium hispanicum TaxID=1080232 RepID=UPI002540E71D|nr:monooxygenase [Penicillium hispanicum]KAJ5574134.1 monooxygenase [Penicillium hispanicum]
MTAPGKPHVLIIGPGLGDLALAQALHQQDILVEAFQPSLDPRFQAWTIGHNSVIDELMMSLPSQTPHLSTVEVFLPLALPTQTTFNPNHGAQSAGNEVFFRRDGQYLQPRLANNTPVHFDKIVSTLHEGADGRITVHFTDSTRATGDIVVGAEGFSSALRQNPVQPDPAHVLPMTTMLGGLTVPGSEFGRQLELRYSGYATGDAGLQNDGREKMSVGLGPASADDPSGGYYYWSMTDGTSTASGSPQWLSSDMPETASGVIEKTGLMQPDVTEATPSFREREIQSLPAGDTTLLGDAAHCMTLSVRGEGGVQAMRHALHLSRTMANSGATKSEVQQMMAEYQEKMLRKGGDAIGLSREQWTRGSEATRASWSAEGTILPPQKVSAGDCPFVKLGFF